MFSEQFQTKSQLNICLFREANRKFSHKLNTLKIHLSYSRCSVNQMQITEMIYAPVSRKTLEEHRSKIYPYENNTLFATFKYYHSQIKLEVTEFHV